MGKDRYNPYNSSQYFDLPKPAPIYEPESVLTPAAGMSLMEIESMRRMKRDAEEAAHRTWWEDKFGGYNITGRSALERAVQGESNISQRDCTDDNWRTDRS